MAWAKLDDTFWMHPKVIIAGNAGAGIFARMLAYCGCYLTDGLVPKQIAESIVGRDKGALDALVEYGMVERLESGSFFLPDYLEYNRSKERVEEERRIRARNGAKGGRPKAGAQ